MRVLILAALAVLVAASARADCSTQEPVFIPLDRSSTRFVHEATDEHPAGDEYEFCVAYFDALPLDGIEPPPGFCILTFSSIAQLTLAPGWLADVDVTHVTSGIVSAPGCFYRGYASDLTRDGVVGGSDFGYFANEWMADARLLP